MLHYCLELCLLLDNRYSLPFLLILCSFLFPTSAFYEKIYERLIQFPLFLCGKEQNWLTKDEYEMLSIRKGTLSDKERDIMQSHAVMTDKLLSQIQFSTELCKNALYCSGKSRACLSMISSGMISFPTSWSHTLIIFQRFRNCFIPL